MLADLEPHRDSMCAAITRLKKNEATAHIPVIAFANSTEPQTDETARTAGATLVVSDNALLVHLEQFLEQALQVD